MTRIVRLNPISQYSGMGVTRVGGSNNWGVLSDGLDTTYLHATAAGQYLNFNLTALTLAANERVVGCQCFIRNARDAASGGTQPTYIGLWDKKLTFLTGRGGYASSRMTTTIVTLAGPKAPKAIIGRFQRSAPSGGTQQQQLLSYELKSGEWMQDDLDRMILGVSWQQTIGGTKNVFQRVYEMYVEVEIMQSPIVSGAPIVTNYTNNATPNISWVWGDPDFDSPQVYYEVKVFDSAMIGSGNFDVSTSAPTWSTAYSVTYSNKPGQSGTVNYSARLGTDQDIDVSISLQNGVTYTAYVRLAKIGISGEMWWSDWVASAPFTVTFTPPITPAISSAVVLADTNQYRSVLSVQVPFNPLTNDSASFEAGIGFWQALANCVTPVRVTTQYADGIASMQMQASAAGDMTAVCLVDNILGEPRADTGVTYTVVASFKSAVTARACAVGIRWVNSAGGVLSISYGANVTDGTGGWIQAFYTGVAPAGTTGAEPVVKIVSAAANEIHYVDKIDIHAGTLVAYSPGGYRNDQAGILVERGEFLIPDRGVADNWFSLHVASASSVMQIPAYGFWWDTNSELKWQWLNKIIPEVGDTPSGMIRWKPIIAAASSIGIGLYYYGGASYNAPVVPGQAHTFSIWAWTDTGTFLVAPRIDWRYANGDGISSSVGGNVTLTTTPQKLVVTATAPANAAGASGALMNVSSDISKHIYFTRAGFGLGTSPVDGKRAMGNSDGWVHWTPLRFQDNDPQGWPPGYDTGQSEISVDYDYPPGRPVYYRASVTYSFGSNLVGSALSPLVIAYGAPPVSTLLRSATDPTLQVAVNRRKQSTYSIVDEAQVFHPLGADRAPIRVRDWIGGEDGDLICLTSTEAQYARMREIIQSADVLLVQWAQGGKSYILITTISSDETITSDKDWCDADGLQGWTKYRVTTLSYVETAAP